MKKNSTLLFLLILSFSLFSQNFQILATDPEGDPSQSVNDVERFSVAMDQQKDSLWFQLDFHQNLSGDVGFVFGIDTDQDPNTGAHAWNGVQTGLNCEAIFIINRNSIDPSFFYGSSTIGGLGQEAIQLNDTSILVKLQLSKIDPDGMFNLIMGSGFFDAALTNRRVYDEIPTTGWVSVSPATGNEPLLSEEQFLLYPQPATESVNIEMASPDVFSETTISLFDLQGKCVQKQPLTGRKHQLNIKGLNGGIYLVEIRRGTSFIRKKLMIQ
ncbi:MAG: T9SS type A sorting domain-containing protein [Bacteroidia bacterium]